MPDQNPIRILIINPNTNTRMTDSLHAPIASLNYNNTTYTYLTAPTGTSPVSINSPADAALSTPPTLAAALPLLEEQDAVLVACYSPHPLISALRERIRMRGRGAVVMGIFEASVGVAVSLLGEGGDGDGEERFGIVSTGEIWKEVLGDGVREMLGPEKCERVFAGVECVGLGAGDLHAGEEGDGDGDGEVERRVRGAARRLVGGSRGGGGGGKGSAEGMEKEGKEGRVGVVILGCAGMVGMEEWVREEAGEGVRVVDGVRAGVGVLQGLVRGVF